MIYISLDPSTKSTGYGIFEDDKLLEYGVWQPSDDFEWRGKINYLSSQLHNLINTYKADGFEVVVIAECPIKTIQNSVTLERLFSLHGSIMAVAHLDEVPFIPVEVSGWRKALGLAKDISRGEDKKKILKERSVNMANDIYGLDLNLSDNDISDALLIGTTVIRNEVEMYG